MEGDDYSDAATVVHLGECFKGRTMLNVYPAFAFLSNSSNTNRTPSRRVDNAANRKDYLGSVFQWISFSVFRERLDDPI
jgi:hypothetical protein